VREFLQGSKICTENASSGFDKAPPDTPSEEILRSFQHWQNIPNWFGLISNLNQNIMDKTTNAEELPILDFFKCPSGIPGVC
jgi:hypothetical protein